MRVYKSLVNHDPDNGQWGDCYRVCIAWLLNRDAESVPHFMEKGEDTPDKPAEEWLRQRGHYLVTICYAAEPAEVKAVMAHLNPGMPYLLTGQSSNHPCAHVVGCVDEVVTMNPSTSEVNEAYEGYTWIEFLASFQKTEKT